MVSQNKVVVGKSDSRWGKFAEINDGNAGSMWHAADNTRDDSWLAMDLGAEYKISHMVLKQPNHKNYGYQQLAIEYSRDSQQWFSARGRADSSPGCAPNGEKTHAGWAGQTRFVRVKFMSMCGGNHFAVSEWRIYGEEYNGCAAEDCCVVKPPDPPPSCMFYECGAGFMRSNTGFCTGKKACSKEQCCEESKYGPSMHCKAWGDPHIMTFDGVMAERMGQDVFNRGEYYIVNSPNVQIQARLTYSKWPKSSIGEIMMQGDALVGKLLNIKWDGTVQYGNQRISNTFNDDDISITFGAHHLYGGSADGGIRIKFKNDESVDLVVGFRGQNWLRSVAMHANHGAGDGLLDLGINMLQRPGVSGFCGNMNHNQADDGQFVQRDASRVRKSLWNHPMVVEFKPPAPKCEGKTKQDANHFCGLRIKDVQSDEHATCVFDHCMGGPDLAGMGLELLPVEDETDEDKVKGKR